YVVVGDRGVSTGNGFLEAGVYRYDVRRHALVLVKRGDVRDALARAALDQEWVRNAPVDIVICAVYERTTRIYGERGYRYVYIEVGHAGQNIYLMATALRLGTVAVGAFYDERVAEIIGARRGEHPLYIMPVGVPAWFPTTTFEDIHELYTGLGGSGGG
ncbi:MAG: nitroreductase, partial [Thermoprotei archaeon]